MNFAEPVHKKYFLIVMDAFSNWAHVKVMQPIKWATVITCLTRLFAAEKLPDVIASDNGTAFTSTELKEFPKLNAIHNIHTALYHLASYGCAERMAREVKPALKKHTEVNTQCKISQSLFQQLRQGKETWIADDGPEANISTQSIAF